MAFKSGPEKSEYLDSEIEAVKEGKINADELAETQALGDLVKSEIIGAILGQSAREKWQNKLESARAKGIDGLKAVREELAEWKQAKETYLALFTDSEVWRDETIKKYETWLEDLTPREIESNQRRWHVFEYTPRRLLVDKFKTFPQELQDKSTFRDFYKKGFEERKDLVEQMEDEQIKNFEDKIKKSSFSKKDKESAINAFKQADLATRALHLQQLSQSIEASNNQVKQSEKLFKELKQNSSHFPKDLQKKFTEGSFEERQKVIETLQGHQEGKGLIKYCQELNKYFKKGIISEKTKNEYEKWATRDIAINAGPEGVLWAINELPNQMYDRQVLVQKHERLLKECHEILPPTEIKKERKKFEAGGYHDRLKAHEALHLKINELKKNLNLSENVPTSVRGLLTAAESVFKEAQNYTDPASRKTSLELARNSYDTIKKFAQENGNSSLLSESMNKIREIDQMLEGKKSSPENVDSEATKSAFENMVNDMIKNSPSLQRELWYQTLMKYTVQDAKLKSLQAGGGSQSKRAENQLHQEHHKEIQKELAQKDATLTKEGTADEVTSIDITDFGVTDSDGKTLQRAQKLRSQVATSESERITADIKFIDADGKEVMPEDAEKSLKAREAQFDQNLINTMISEPKAQELLPDTTTEDQLQIFSKYLQSMRDHGKISADIFREEAKSV